MNTQKPSTAQNNAEPVDKKQETTPPATTEHGARSTEKTPAEHGGRRGPEPTRYGDWENGGKCVDF